MAQHDYTISNATFPAVRTDLNNALSAIQTTNSGTSRPTGAVAGQLWLDTTSATTPTLKYYDGADDISLATIDHSANTVNWLDSTVSITGLSTTATGTVLTLSDSVNTTTVNLIIDNQKEIRFREATANGTNYISLSAPASVTADVTYTLPVAPTTNNQALISSTAGVMSFTPYSFPSTDGTAGQVLQTNGSGVLSFASAGLAWQSVVTASTLTAVANRGYWIDTTSNACTVTLPASATNGDTIILADYARKWGTNAVTINQNSLNFQGYTDPNPIYNTSGQSVTLIYSGATQGWIPTVDDDVTNEVPQTVNIDFLVIAGGASGAYGSGRGGGGGAGGYRTSTQTGLSLGTVITVTVGDGGATTSGPNRGNSGSNSSISGSGLTTITSAGGGGGGSGGSTNNNGVAGGSGGGAGNNNGGGTGGAGNTPSTSPSQGNNGGTSADSAPHYVGGGGGGAGSVGVNGAGTGGGTVGWGGTGTASSITGSSVTRAGGGGGGTYGSISVAGQGRDGGGNGGATSPAVDATAGTANTGGGGGGGRDGGNGFAGGKGVVILSMLTSKYSGTSTGSPTVTTSGSNTILQFNGSGSYTT
jgi:hypothetical protein